MVLSSPAFFRFFASTWSSKFHGELVSGHGLCPALTLFSAPLSRLDGARQSRAEQTTRIAQGCTNARFSRRFRSARARAVRGNKRVRSCRHRLLLFVPSFSSPSPPLPVARSRPSPPHLSSLHISPPGSPLMPSASLRICSSCRPLFEMFPSLPSCQDRAFPSPSFSLSCIFFPRASSSVLAEAFVRPRVRSGASFEPCIA